MHLSITIWSFLPWNSPLPSFVLLVSLFSSKWSYVLSLMIPVRSFHIKLSQSIYLKFLTSAPFFESFITRIVLPLTNHPGTFPTSIHSFKNVANTPRKTIKGFKHGSYQVLLLFNLELTFLLIFTAFFFSDDIFSLVLSVNSASGEKRIRNCYYYHCYHYPYYYHYYYYYYCCYHCSSYYYYYHHLVFIFYFWKL